MKPLVSIIIPIYNVEAYLEETVNSVCNQTYKNIEIILVNDGSTDNSGMICNLLAEKDYRIKVINKLNGGLSSARNTGIDNASGDYLFFLDGDDYIAKESITVLLDQFRDRKNIGIVSAPCFYSFDKDKIFIYRKDWVLDSQRIISPENFCILALEQKICFSACCKLYKKELFDKVRFRIGKRNEDTLFMFDLSFVLNNEKLYMVEITDKLYYYRVNNGSITRNIAFPIQIDYIENLKTMMTESVNTKIIQCLKRLYYNEIISFKSLLLLNDTIKNSIDINAKNIFLWHNNSIKLKDVLKFALPKNILKYLLIEYFTFLYIIIHKIKQSFNNTVNG